MMQQYKITDLSFLYPNENEYALANINININKGEFITICGKSGCGKTTLLRLLKPLISPVGAITGDIYFENQSIKELDEKSQSSLIGYVSQSPENQIVTDKVWHELAFGLESLSMSTPEIRSRVGEIASFFGIENLFHKNTSELSGGQKQTLNLASVITMQPHVLILDEPTSQLDPISASEFITLLSKINSELGTTIILCEHRLEEVYSVSDRIIVMDNGKIISDASPYETGKNLSELRHEMFYSLPVPVRMFYDTKSVGKCTVSIREAKNFIETKTPLHPLKDEKKSFKDASDISLYAKDIFFRYEKNSADILNGFSIQVKQGEFYSILGGNGTGKTTALSVLCGILKPYGGKIRTNGKISCLPQDVQTVFVKKTVIEDLHDIENADEKSIENAVEICELENLLNRHPFDLSGGEQQRCALAKVLLTKPKILFLDEPTKGLDSHFKRKLSNTINILKKSGITVVAVSHDIEFCALYSDRCAMFFDGKIISEGTPREFFGNKSFYTTAANKIAREADNKIITEEELVYAITGEMKKEEIKSEPPKKKKELQEKPPVSEKTTQIKKEAVAPLFITALAVPLTVLFGIYFLNDRKYYFISMLIILETLIPFAMVFEKRNPRTRELVVISVLCALGVAGRIAFAPLQQFKPVLAIIIISGICFGADTGFLTGAVTAFISNIYFSQGPWTPWQMVAFGFCGFFAGLFFKKIKPSSKLFLCVYGFLSAIIFYGGIINLSSVLMYEPYPTAKMIIAAYIAGFPFDVLHGLSTFFFLWFIARPLMEKLERIKTKYDIL